MAETIETFEQLEVALLFGRGPESARSEDAIAAELRLPSAAVVDALDRLTRAGLLTRSANSASGYHLWRSAPGTTLATLAERYDRDRVAIMQLMTTNALDRVRTSALRAFSSAFLLKRKHDG